MVNKLYLNKAAKKLQSLILAKEGVCYFMDGSIVTLFLSML